MVLGRRLGVVFLIACALAVAGCKRRGCSDFSVEIAVPRNAGPAVAVTNINLITPGGYSGTGAPMISRTEGNDDIYEFSTLAFHREEKRTLAVGLSDGTTIAFSLPAGPQQPSSFTAWATPSYETTAAESGSATWQIMHDTETARPPAGPSLRARHQFAAYECH